MQPPKQASALIEHYSFAWRMTGNPAWLRPACASTALQVALRWGPDRCMRFSLSPAAAEVLQAGRREDSASARARRTT